MYYSNQCISYKNFDFEFLNNNRVFFTSISKYNKLKGVDWPTYEEFVNNKFLADHVYREIFHSNLTHDLFFPLNRDGFHLNYIGNKMVCDYFLNQISHTPN